MNTEYDESNMHNVLHNALHMDNLHEDRRSQKNMDDDGNGLDDEDGAVVQRRYSVSPIQWTKAMQCIADTVDKADAVGING